MTDCTTLAPPDVQPVRLASAAPFKFIPPPPPPPPADLTLEDFREYTSADLQDSFSPQEEPAEDFRGGELGAEASEQIARQRAEERDALLRQFQEMTPDALADERLLHRLAVTTTATLAPVDEAMAVLASLLLADAAADASHLLKRLEAIKKMATISHTLQLRIQAACEGAQTLRLRRSQGRG